MIIRINKKSARSNSADAPPDRPLIARVKAERRFTQRYISSSAGGLIISIFPFSFFCVPAAAPFLLLVGCCLQLRGSWQRFRGVFLFGAEAGESAKREEEEEEGGGGREGGGGEGGGLLKEESRSCIQECRRRL